MTKMENEGRIKKYSRKELIKLFQKGSLPSDEDFKKLINSNFNKADDNLDVSPELGLQIYPVKTGQLLNFFEDPDDNDPKFEILITSKGLFLQEASNFSNENDGEEKEPEFYIEKESGYIGLGKNEPKEKLDVKGIIASEGRIGSFKEGQLAADGNWHNIFEENLTDVHAFEVMASARGKKSEGRYSILHSIVTSVFGKSKRQGITSTRSQYDYSDRIEIRVVSKPTLIKRGRGLGVEKMNFFKKIFLWWKIVREGRSNEYNVQLRTNRHFGGRDDPNSIVGKINYKVSLLWGPDTIDEKQSKRTSKYDNEKNAAEIDALIAGKEEEKKIFEDLNKGLSESVKNDKLKEYLKSEIESNNNWLNYLVELKRINGSLMKFYIRNSKNEIDASIRDINNENRKLSNLIGQFLDSGNSPKEKVKSEIKIIEDLLVKLNDLKKSNNSLSNLLKDGEGKESRNNEVFVQDFEEELESLKKKINRELDNIKKSITSKKP